MAQKWLPASSLTGGSEGSLDAIDGSNLSDGDRAIVIADLVYFYVLDDDSGLSESSPSVIAPDNNAGDKRWILTSVYPNILDASSGKIDIDASSATLTGSVTHGGIIGGYDNSMDDSHYSVIIGGHENSCADDINRCLILGGDFVSMSDNVYDCGALGGQYNELIGNIHQSVILGGYNVAMSDNVYDCGALGGQDNELIGNIDQSVILGGRGNAMKNHAYRCGMIGGWDLSLGNDCDCSGFLGGHFNVINDGSDDCCVVAGYANSILGDSGESGIIGGDSCQINDAINSIILSGYWSKICSADSATIIGTESIAGQADNIVAMGDKALANIQGQRAFADGKFSIVGDAQFSDFVLIVATTDDTETPAPVDGLYDGIPLMTARSCRFDISIAARQTAGTAGNIGDSAIWKITGGIKNIGATLAQGTVTFSGVAEEDDTITIKDVTYTFKSSPDYTENELPIMTSASAQAASFQYFVNGHAGIMSAELSGSDVVLTAFPNFGTDANAWTFTTDGVNISCDGSGAFGGTSVYSSGTVSFFGTPQGTGTPGANDHDVAIAAQGTITMSGLPVADETFVIDTQTFTWKASRSTTGEVTIGADAAECVTNIVTAVGLDLTTAAAEDGDGNTVVLTAVTSGSAGNSIALTEASTNMTVDGSGTLGGTTEGEDRSSLWEVDVEADNIGKLLKVNVTGETDKTIHWTAKVELVEVG
jgi:hypothetical protein